MHDNNLQKPWLIPPPFFTKCNVIIIGGGIAGASTAFSLAKRGFKVTVLEKNKSIANEGSGNSQGIFYAQFSPNDDFYHQFLHESYFFSLSLIENLALNSSFWNNCGVLYFPQSEKMQKRYLSLSNHKNFRSFCSLLSQSKAEKIAGIPLLSGGFFVENGGTVQPRNLIKTLLNHENISVKCATNIQKIEKIDSNWHIFCKNNQKYSAEIVILANAYNVIQFTQSHYFPIVPIRGQTSELPTNEKSKKLNIALSGKHYICPNLNEKLLFGATLFRNETNKDIKNSEHLINFQNIKSISPYLFDSFDQNSNSFSGHAAIRCATLDRFPLVGGLAEPNEFFNRFQRLSVDAKANIEKDCPWFSGLYINVGHGTKGLTTAPFCGEVLADLITNQTKITSQKIVNLLNPNRFLIKKIIQGVNTHKN